MDEEESGSNRLIVTRDGSHTVYSSHFDQKFHNPNGAIAESRYVFFEQTGLLSDLESAGNITILEVGFGTGLNLMLLLNYYLELGSHSQIDYYSIEGFPLRAATAGKLNYEESLDHPEAAREVTAVFNSLDKGMNDFDLLERRISLHLFNGLFSELPQLSIEADYIFHDAFSPDVNPDLWTGEVFQKIRSLSAPDAVLATYCAASQARGAMAWAGWYVARAKGALGKREMSLASPDPERLGNLKLVNNDRYARRYEEGDF